MLKKKHPFPRHRKKKHEANTAPAVSWTQYFGNAAHQLFTSVKSTLYSFFEDQQVLESTNTYKIYSSAVIASSAVQCFSPLVFRPYPVALAECGWNMVTWGSIALFSCVIPDHRVRLSFQLLINTLRFLEEDTTAACNLVALLLVHIPPIKHRLSHEQQALVYISITHIPTTLNAYHYVNKMSVLRIENDVIIKKHEAILNITLNDPYQDAEKYFFIYKNVPHLAQARNKFFSEYHRNKTHHDLQNLFIASMSQVGDTVVLEDKPSMEFFDCGFLKTFYNRTFSFPLFAGYDYHYEFAEQLTCVGWDNVSMEHQQSDQAADFINFQKAQDILWSEASVTGYTSPIMSIDFECQRQKEFFNRTSAQRWIDSACEIWMQEFSQPHPKLKNLWKKILLLEDEYSASVKEAHFKSVQDRNKVLVDTDRSLSSSSFLNFFGLFKRRKRFGVGQQFWISGAHHTLPNNFPENPAERIHQTPTPQDAAFELREHFGSQPGGYAILYPR